MAQSYALSVRDNVTENMECQADRPFVFRGLIQCSCGCTITSYIKKEKYTYLRCSHYKGNCKTKPLNEDVALAQVKTTLKNLHLDEEIMHYIRADMERIIDNQSEFQRRQLAKARKKYDECVNGLKNIRLDYAKQRISADEYNEISSVLKEEQYKLEDEMSSLTQADERFSIALGTVLSLGSNAYDIFSSSQVETKRAILNIVLANFKLDGQKFSYDLRKPFDWVQSLNKKTPSKSEGVAIGDPNEIRTRVTAVRGRCPRPLDDGTITSCQSITSNSQNMQALFRHKSAQAPITLNFRLQICLGYTINRIDKILLSTKIKKI